ncbi:hypothetical protein C8P63_10180 [Melghirimyces profundicolus]|uniref:Uncharacterized protein n=1 Tax=Melghirimyces profundicolus TaxID=1242148 RepID=A0A2T6C968_9BACL|nr:hypothetical protein [Melghirimyces profundicolus]PTX64862.1 hypothetical protein C8P63_10180 [Melghirimyces profundicolus]
MEWLGDLLDMGGILIIPILYFLLAGFMRRLRDGADGNSGTEKRKPWFNPWDEEEVVSDRRESPGEPKDGNRTLSRVRATPGVAPAAQLSGELTRDLSPQVLRKTGKRQGRRQAALLGEPLKRKDWRRAVILKEILDEPVSRRRRRRR